MKAREKCVGFAYRAALFLIMIAVVLILIGSLGYVQEKIFDGVFPAPLRMAFTLMLAAMICVFLVLLYRSLNRLNKRQLIAASVALFGIMLLVFAAVFLGFRTVSGSDAMDLQDMAIYFAKTGEVPISEASPHYAYFGYYANNYFFTILLSHYFKLCMALGISDMYYPMLTLSVAGILTAAVFMFLIGVRMKGLCAGVKALALCALNPLYYVLALWVYTNAFSIPFMMAGLYFVICAYQAERSRSRGIACILAAVSAALGYYIRPTAVIPVIAAAICAFLWGIKSKKNMLRVLRCAVLSAVAALLLAKGISVLNERYFGPVFSRNFPVTHWLNMGSHGTGGHNSGDDRFIKQFKTKEEKSAAALQEMIGHYRSYSPLELADFFYRKMALVWGYGNSGDMLIELMQDRKMTPLYSWVVGDHMDFFRACCFAFRIATLFLMLVALWDLLTAKKIDPYQFLFALSFFGGVLFYCFWEAKNSYSLPFVYIMLLIGMHGADVLAGKTLPEGQSFPELRKTPGRFGRRRGAVRPLAVLGLLCAAGISLFAFRCMTGSFVLHRDWSVRCREGISITNINVKSGRLELSQEFYASKPFNSIELSGGADETAVAHNAACRLTLLDTDGAVVYETEITAAELTAEKYLILQTDLVIPEGKTKYTLKLDKPDEGGGKIYFRRRTGNYLDSYDGTLTVNGKELSNDLFLHIYREYEGPWCSAKAGAAITGLLILAAAGLCLWLWRSARAA